MHEADMDRFGDLVTNVHAFYGKAVSSFAIGVWWGQCKSYDFDAVADALNRHCGNPDSGQFMPRPADAVKMLSGSTLDGAMIAWSKVDRAVRQVGTYSSAVFDDAIIHKTIQDMGGWVAVGGHSDDDWPYIAKEFQNRYKGYRLRNDAQGFPKVMVGIAEAQNRQCGLPVQPPVVIGDRLEAIKVYRLGNDGNEPGFVRLKDSDFKRFLKLEGPGDVTN